ncbi:hypothetical protein SAMN05660657_04297 [Geodermatophilus amargosae]|uniref:Uncharacterized protein n=1 Tax=Geodermatophilus amargosae TaxID=1296565 RepID=A0A1I7CBX2_9ACTN|nr:hypothetical protein [Geodermatophilus amargosae]SFT96912.1 hypothetical protein SAMN05660657_04297 [Geodermatophilus amargosae]
MPDELFEVLTQREDGHQTVHRVTASSKAAAECAVAEATEGDRRVGEVVTAVPSADGGIGDAGHL